MQAKVIEAIKLMEDSYSILMQVQDDEGNPLLNETAILPDLDVKTVKDRLDTFAKQYTYDTQQAVINEPVAIPSITVTF